MEHKYLITDYNDDLYEADIEEMILGMARLVRSKRRLEDENAELREYKQKYDELLDRTFKESQANSANILKTVLAGIELASR